MHSRVHKRALDNGAKSSFAARAPVNVSRTRLKAARCLMPAFIAGGGAHGQRPVTAKAAANLGQGPVARFSHSWQTLWDKAGRRRRPRIGGCAEGTAALSAPRCPLCNPVDRCCEAAAGPETLECGDPPPPRSDANLTSCGNTAASGDPAQMPPALHGTKCGCKRPEVAEPLPRWRHSGPTMIDVEPRLANSDQMRGGVLGRLGRIRLNRGDQSRSPELSPE